MDKLKQEQSMDSMLYSKGLSAEDLIHIVPNKSTPKESVSSSQSSKPEVKSRFISEQISKLQDQRDKAKEEYSAEKFKVQQLTDKCKKLEEQLGN